MISGIELLLATVWNIQSLACGILVALLVLGGFSLLAAAISEGDAIPYLKPWFKAYFTTAIVCAILSILPTPDNLWKVRISLIKLQLASPENIAKGVDVIERIGKTLECKYVGCEPAKEKK